MGRRRGARGFSMIELLVVLVILAILAAVVVPKFTGRTEQARETAAKTDIAMLGTALNGFEIDNGRYPSSDEGLNALVDAPAGLKNWHGPYVERLPKDPWGNSYQYRQPGSRSKAGFDLYSFGADGHDGGNDDVGNWGE